MSTKPDASSRLTVAIGVSKWADPSQPSPMPASTRWIEAMLPTPPHWATSQPPGRRTAREVREERVVIGDPVERGGRQDRVDRRPERQRSAEVGDDELDPVAERRQPVARGLDHRGRAIERDHPATGQSPGKQLGDPAAAAAGVEDAFVAGEREPLEDGRAPAGHRVGDPVVRPRVPVARHLRPHAVGAGGSAAAAAAGEMTRAPILSRKPNERDGRPDDEQTRHTTSIARWKASIEACVRRGDLLRRRAGRAAG